MDCVSTQRHNGRALSAEIAQLKQPGGQMSMYMSRNKIFTVRLSKHEIPESLQASNISVLYLHIKHVVLLFPR